LNLTNKSDIIRRALLNYLSPEEAAIIMGSVLRDDVKPVKYPRKK
jgi:hypothetical protein